MDVALYTEPPWADLRLLGLPSGTTQVRVWRSWGQNLSRVRGDDTVVVSGTEGRLVDYDMPVGRPVRWRVDAYNAAGGRLESTLVPTQYSVPGTPGHAWVSDPLQPPGAVQVRLLQGTDARRQRAAEGLLLPVLGSPVPVAVTSRRQAVRDWTWRVFAPDRETALALDEVIDSGGVLLFRTGPEELRNPSGLMYVWVPTVEQTMFHDATSEMEVHEFVASITRGPALPALLHFRTWDDVDAEVAGTWADFDALYAGKYWAPDVDRGL